MKGLLYLITINYSIVTFVYFYKQFRIVNDPGDGDDCASNNEPSGA